MKLTYRLRQGLLVLGDVCTYYIGFVLALGIRTTSLPSGADIAHHIGPFTVLFLLWITANYVNGLYDLRLMTLRGHTRRVIESAIIAILIGMVFFYLIPSPSISPKTILVLTTGIGFFLAALFRALYVKHIGKHKLKTRILFLGMTEEVRELIDIITAHPNLGYHISVIIDPDTNTPLPPDTDITVYQTLNTLRPAIDTQHIHTVIVAPHMNDREEVRRELYELLFWPVEIMDMTSFYETVTGRIPPSTFSETWFLKNLRTMDKPVYTKAKRGIDVIVGIFFGLLLILILPVVALAITYTSRGPIFFKQRRVGEGGKTFLMYKFRTMYALAEDGSAEIHGAEFAKKDDVRITRIGKFLRKTRFDELPQALNLLKGEVTFIGPRPERPEIVHALTETMPYYPLRHIIRPGLTGWAVIHQHYTDDMQSSLKKLQYDLYYIKNRSILLDISIALKTINVIVRGMGQ